MYNNLSIICVVFLFMMLNFRLFEESYLIPGIVVS
jgi:hypothetical protein